MRRLLVAVIAGLVAPLVAQARAAAGGATPPGPDSLATITARGRLLAQYDFVAWHATDAMLALGPAEGEVHGYVARPTDSGWVAVFGRLSDDSTAYLVAFEARQSSIRPDSFTVAHYRPARPDTGYVVRAARALGTAARDFGPATRPYNAAVLPASGGAWWVYLVPAQTVAGVYPLGGDVRYVVSGDGRHVVARRQLHQAILEFGASADSGAPVAGAQATVLDNVPEDTDVFHVLVRRPRVPQYVVTEAWVYRIELDGTIRLLGRREDVLGR